MRWKLLCTTAAFFVFVGVSLADQFRAVILEVKDGKVTFAPTKFDPEVNKFIKGASRALPAADGIKVAKVKFDQGKPVAGDVIEGGLKNEMFTNIAAAGVNVYLNTSEDGKITEILILAGKK